MSGGCWHVDYSRTTSIIQIMKDSTMQSAHYLYIVDDISKSQQGTSDAVLFNLPNVINSRLEKPIAVGLLTNYKYSSERRTVFSLS